MCTTKDVDAALKQFQDSQGREEKKKILQQLMSCETCEEKPAPLMKEDALCRCEVYRYTEFFNTIEQVIQNSIFEK